MQTKKTGVWQAQWIAASDDMLSGIERFPGGGVPMGKWIWPQAAVRVYMRRDFTVDGPVRAARLRFQCDNEFTLYINGHAVRPRREGALWDTGVADAAGLLTAGVNHLGVRAFQSAEPAHFTAALRGGIHIETMDGSKRDELTGDDWSAWRVCGFYEQREPGGWDSAPEPGARWGLLSQSIHPRLLRRSCYFRTEFDVPGGVRSAVLRATARGFFEAYINGRRVGDALLQPGAIEKEQPYCETDVTGLLLPGRNVLAAVTGNGWLNCSGWGLLSAHKPALLMELAVTDAEGRVRFVGTGEDWMAAPSPIIDNDLQLGERVDARLQIPGWNTASAGSAGWMPVKTLPGGFPGRPLVRDDCPPIRVAECRRPLSFREILPGVYLYDFGTNAAGRVRLNVRGARPGQTITIRHFERLDEHGAPHRGSYCDVFFPADSEPDGKAPYALKNTDVYICRGDAVERFESRFTYTGYRYATVEGYPGTPDPADVEGLVLHNDLPVTGALLTDSPQIESLWQAITRTYRSNIHSGPTDCPTREKNFWNGDIQAFADTACWYMDNSRFLARWTRAGRKITYGVYGWEDEEYIVPWTLYRFYGDTEILRVKYPVILRLIENRTAALTGPLPGGEAAPWRDHLAVENVPADFYAGCYYCLMLMRAAQIADVLGRGGDARDFRGRFETARAAFHERYYLPGEGDYAPRCQTGVVLPLAFGLTPEPCRARAAARLHDYVAERGYHPTTGFMATPHLLPLLCDYGYGDAALRTLLATGYPSWLYMLETGATTITASWRAQSPTDPYASMNHCALGGVGRWFFEYLGGIRPGEECAFGRFALQPVFAREVGRFEVRYRSPRGPIRSAWTAQGDGFRWEFSIPGGAPARVTLPSGQTEHYPPGDHSLHIAAL